MDRLTAEQAARLLGYHVKHLYRLVREGKVPYEDFGDMKVFDPDVIAKLCAMQGKGGRIRWEDRKEQRDG